MYKLFITFIVAVMVTCGVFLVTLIFMLSERIWNVSNGNDLAVSSVNLFEKKEVPPAAYSNPPSFAIPNRRLTQQEVKDWTAQYYADGGANELEIRLLELINSERAERNLARLDASPALMKAARIKSQSMAHLGYFSSSSPIYGDFNVIPYELFSYPINRSMKINIAGGFNSPEAVFSEWLDNGQFLESGFTEAGLGLYNYNWTLIAAEGPSADAVAALRGSSILLPNRTLTQYEMDAWIAEYNLLGGANQFELEIVRLTNLERERHGLPPLTINPLLMMISRFKSQSMGNLDYISHIGIYGSPGDLAKAFGFNNRVGENLFRGAMAPEEAVVGWMDSPGHRQNILSESFQSIGVGVYMDANGRVGWAQMFGFQ